MSSSTTGHHHLLLLALSAVILLSAVESQPQRNNRPTSFLLRPMSPVRSTASTVSTSNPTIRPEEVDRNSSDVLESRQSSFSLTIQPEDRQKLRQSVMDLTKRRRVTAIKPTMSPDVISTPNVYHFFSKKRFERVKSNTTKNLPEGTSTTTTTTTTTTEASAAPGATLDA